MKTKMPSLGTIIGWLVLGGLYLMSLPTIILPIIIIGIMAFSWWAFEQDKEREKQATDDFKEMGLLFRYGYEVNDIALPIFIDRDFFQVKEISDELARAVYQSFQEVFSDLSMEVLFPVLIRDKDYPADQREFLKVIIKTKRESQLSHFIHFAVTGKYVVVHFTTKIRGRYEWYNLVSFILASPLTVWFWGMDWWKNQYSIVASLSTIIDNSYDLMDLTSYFQSTYLMVWRTIEKFLKERDLLPEDVQQIIVNNITNTQHINISRSRQVNLGNLVNRVQGVVPGLVRQGVK